jgi:hypothetical protein
MPCKTKNKGIRQMNVDALGQAISEIKWLWFAIAAIIAYGIGAIWYSLLFSKAWVRVFKVEMGQVTTGSFIRTMGGQLLGTALLGFVFFVLAKISVAIAILALIGFCGWEKSTLNFQFAKLKDFMMATLIHVGYTFVAGIVFILFALI